MDGMKGIGDRIGMVGDLAKTRSFPLICVHLSRAVEWDMGVNGADWAGFRAILVVLAGRWEDLGERRLELGNRV